MDAFARRQPALILLLALAACGGPSAPAASAPAPASSATLIEAREAVPFVHDDWPRALADAKRSKRLVFVDAWAPWCHSCQSMRANVFGDRALEPLANDYVWLSIDTEKDENAAFVARFPNGVWPTLWVIDPERDAPVLKWTGTATAPELVQLLTAVKSGGADSVATTAFVRATHAAARGDTAEAEAGYRDALTSANALHPQRPRIVEALVSSLSGRDAHVECAETALRYGVTLPPGTSRATVLAEGLSCARDAKRDDLLAPLALAAEAAAEDPDPRTLPDDRHALYEELFETKKAAGDAAGAHAIAERWVSYLDKAAEHAATKQARAALDPDRLLAYLALGTPDRAIPMLEQSEREFPDDYNPPARLALVYLEKKDNARAQAAIDRASARVYGPRAMRVFATAADIAKARGDVAAERRALEQALGRTAHASLSPGQKKARDRLEKRLSELPK
ncbi:MAG TPA: thioredoxin family protein [Labilithrix sp.]